MLGQPSEIASNPYNTQRLAEGVKLHRQGAVPEIGEVTLSEVLPGIGDLPNAGTPETLTPVNTPLSVVEVPSGTRRHYGGCTSMGRFAVQTF
jgi:hypothetical protein